MDPHLNATGVNMDDSDHLARLRHRFDCAKVLLHDGNPVGLLKVSRDNQDWEIIQVQLAPEHRGHGLGAKLLKQVIAEAVAAGATLTLSVLKANPARLLYERLGFVVVGQSELEYNMRHQV